RWRVHAAQCNAGAPRRFLVGAPARAPPDPGTFSRPVYSLHDLVEFCLAVDAALRRFGAARPPAPAAILCMASALTCEPRPGRDRPPSARGVSAKFRTSSAVCGFVQRIYVAPVCRAIPRGRAL